MKGIDFSKIQLFSAATAKEKEYFIDSLTMLVASGMGILQALDAIQMETRSHGMTRIMVELKDQIDAGVPLWQALRMSGLLADHFIALVRIGEESGKLAQSLKIIALAEQKERVFRSQIRSAVMYPVFVLTVALIMGVATSWFILPRLALVFSQIRVTLPPITRAIMAVGDFMKAHGAVFVSIFFPVLGALGYFLFRFPKTKFIGETILFRLPVIKRLMQEVELGRFGYIFGTLLNAGLPIGDALNSLGRSASLHAYHNFYEHLETTIMQGMSFNDSFKNYRRSSKLIPIPVQQMIAAAEQSGNLGNALLHIGEVYEEKSGITTKNLSVLLEPVLLVVVGLAVTTVALAIILPIYSLIGGFNQPQTQNPPAPPPLEQAAPVAISESEAPASPSSSSAQVASATEMVSETGSGTPSSTPLVVNPAQPLTNSPSPPSLEILPTELGYLNVRDTPASRGNLVTTVQPGEIYFYTVSENGWYRITVSTSTGGWVSGKYIRIRN